MSSCMSSSQPLPSALSDVDIILMQKSEKKMVTFVECPSIPPSSLGTLSPAMQDTDALDVPLETEIVMESPLKKIHPESEGKLSSFSRKSSIHPDPSLVISYLNNSTYDDTGRDFSLPFQSSKWCTVLYKQDAQGKCQLIAQCTQ